MPRALAALAVTMAVVAPLGVLAASPAAASPAAVQTKTAATVTPSLEGYTPVTPVRICDTRPEGTGVTLNQCNGTGGAGAPLGGGATMNVAVAGANSVPGTAIAAVLNVTVTDTTAGSYLTVWPEGVTQPTASNLNWNAGQTVPNLVEVGLGTNGAVSVYNAVGSTNVVIDLEGYVDVSAPGLYNPLSPVRICDTRSVASGTPANQCQSTGGAAGTLGVGMSAVQVAGMGGVPADATGVVMNVTVTDTTVAGVLTVWPDGATQPLASNLNWSPEETVPNRVIVPLPADGKVDVFNATGRADVIFDVNGYVSAAAGGSEYTPDPNGPERVCDTRPIGPGVIDNACNDASDGGPGPITAQGELTLTGPSGVTASVFNVTIADTDAATYLTVFPDNDPDTMAFVTPPVISDLNAVPGQVVANLVVVAAGTTDTLAFYNADGNTDIAVDLEGLYSTSDLNFAAVRARSLVSVHRL